MKIDLSVIVPAYNEEKHIERTVRKAVEFLRENCYSFEVLVIDDGSSDGTLQKSEALRGDYPELKVLRHAINQGKGEAVKTGILQAARVYCLLMDADNSTDISELLKLQEKVTKECPVVVATRYSPGSHIVHPQPLLRRWLGTGYRFLCRFLFKIRGSDFNCGFKIYRTDIAKEVFAKVKMKDWSYDVEVFCRLKCMGVSVAEVPVEWTHFDKPSHASPFVTAYRTFHSLWILKRVLEQS